MCVKTGGNNDKQKNISLDVVALAAATTFGFKGYKNLLQRKEKTPYRQRRYTSLPTTPLYIGNVDIDYSTAGPYPLIDSLRSNINKALYDALYYTEDGTHIACYDGALTDANTLAKFYSKAYYDNLIGLYSFDDYRNLQLEHNVGVLKKI